MYWRAQKIALVLRAVCSEKIAVKPASEWDENYLIELIRVSEQESLKLDYKASAALGKQDKEKNEISKDVSAFANSAGGLLVYGMLEDKHVPTKIDVGVDRNIITKEWLESVIKSRIQPEVGGVVIKQIGLTTGVPEMVAYVVEVSQATSRAPHQAFDHKYYKRHNFESTPMEDYEVRDLMRRSIEFGKVYGVAWDLYVELKRIISAAEARERLGPDHVSRSMLYIAVSPGLRTSGVAIMALPKALRQKSATLINELDRYNSMIEAADPGQRDKARLTEALRELLRNVIGNGKDICNGLVDILKDEPP